MRITTSGVLGIIGALAPLVFIGAFLRYFMGVGGNFGGVVGVGLGPTVLGLAGVGLLFTMPLIIKLVRLTGGTSHASGARAVAEPSTRTEGFDADAALANYMRNREAEPGVPLDANRSEEPRAFANPGGFGRKTV
jgi:hypothetical protein